MKLSDSNNILVGFSWANDDELKYTEMYLEFLCVDITFGLNTERRDLLLIVGIDGNNKMFTSSRCFIPSKQEQAYSWIMNEACSHILTQKSRGTKKENSTLMCI